MAKTIGNAEYRLACNADGEYRVECRPQYTDWIEYEYLGSHDKADAIAMYKTIIAKLEKEHSKHHFVEVDINA